MSNGITHALADLDRLSVGQMASLRERVSAAQVEAFAKLSGDDNPIHLDAAAARSIGEAGPISHGALLLAMLSRLIGTRLPGPGSIWFEQQIEFLAPVYPNDEVEMRAEVVHVSRASRAVVLDVSAVKSGGVQVLRGRAKVRVPQAMAGGATGMDQRDKVALVTLDVIVHCATPAIHQQPYLETTADQFRAFFDTYVLGLHELVTHAAPGMKERRYGRIVALSSSATAEVPAKLAAYVTAKHALLGLCRAQAVELGPWNITVNTVSPSMVVGEYAAAAGLAAREIVARRTPLRRLGEPEDVARVVAFLVSDDAAFITGANVPVTGGVFV